MKILLFSDIHGNIYPLYHMINKNLFKKVDYSVFCGDIFGYYYNQNKIIEILKNINNLSIVMGNHDKMFLDMIDNKIDKNILIKNYGNSYDLHKYNISHENINFIRSLNKSIELIIDNKCIKVMHGGFCDYLNDRIYPESYITLDEIHKKYDYLFLGHTHYKMILNIDNTKIINPGSLGQPRDKDPSSYVIIDTRKNKETFHFIKYDKSKLLAEIVKNNEQSDYSLDILYRGDYYE